jgi:DNA helicase HerA-like ATPase
MGPVMLARILGLTQVQEGVLNIVFRVADENGLLLIDLKDLRSMLSYVSEHAKELQITYGNVSPQSVGGNPARAHLGGGPGRKHLLW